MDVLKISHKGKNLDILEQFHIYKAAKKIPIFNEQYVSDSNVLFDIILDNEDSWVRRNAGTTVQ
jgi:hypothetical protein